MTSLFGEITDRDRNRWRLQAGVVLVELLGRACAEDLPPLTWRLGTANLVATIEPSYGRRDERAEFRAWMDALGLLLQPDVRLTRRTVHRAKGRIRAARGHEADVILTWEEEIDELGLAAAS